MVLDSLDKKILKNLTVDARQLALELEVLTVAIISRIKKLEKEEYLRIHSHNRS